MEIKQYTLKSNGPEKKLQGRFENTCESKRKDIVFFLEKEIMRHRETLLSEKFIVINAYVKNKK